MKQHEKGIMKLKEKSYKGDRRDIPMGVSLRCSKVVSKGFSFLLVSKEREQKCLVSAQALHLEPNHGTVHSTLFAMQKLQQLRLLLI